MKTPSVIDSHQHVNWHFKDIDGLIQDMDEQGIDLSWILTWEIPPYENHPAYHRVLDPVHVNPDGTHAGIPLAALLEAKRRYPDRFVIGYCPHPCQGQAPDLLESAYHIHGVRVCGEFKFRILLDDPRCLNLFRRAGQLGMPVVLHLDVPYLLDTEGVVTYQENWYGGTVANLGRALEACPDTVFVGHAPGFWRELSGDADDRSEPYPEGPLVPGGRLEKMFERYPNLYADLSAGSALRALKRNSEYSTEFLQRFADRILFGRDYYGGELNEFLQSLDLPAEVRDKLYRENAARLLKEADRHSAPEKRLISGSAKSA